MTAPAERAPMLARCKACEHIWPHVWLPCPVEHLQKAMPKGCPSCGASSKQFALSYNAVDLARYADWVEQEAIRARAVAVEAAKALR